MKYYSKSNMYKAGANLSLNAETLEGRSYDWYVISKQFGSMVVVNTYNYSSTTVKHYWKIRKQLQGLGHNVITLEAPQGLQKLDDAKDHYDTLIKDLEALIAKKGTRKSTNAMRLELIDSYKDKLALIAKLEFICRNMFNKSNVIEKMMYRIDGK